MEDDHDGQQLQKLALIKTLLVDYCDLNTICLNDPISQILTKDVMKSLVKDGVLLRKSKHTYAIQKNDKEKEYVSPKVLDRGLMGEDVNYIKALYVTVTMKHVTAEKLRTALKETIGRTTANAFILKMIDDNIVEPRVCK
ncbi:REF/SRPP protein [Trifolium repens]|nr:REF/SRPP protein [Trifolium repens]